MLAEWGCNVVGIDISEDMVEKARTLLPPQFESKVRFERADVHVASFDSASFDLIISKQVACHFYDPLQVFDNWKRWLKDKGKIAIIDGLWSRQGWTNESLIDELPLSCTQTRGTLTYLLKSAGFVIEQSHWLDHVNKYLNTVQQNQRYVVVAGKRST